MTKKLIDKKNVEIAKMLGAEVDEAGSRIFIDKMIDDDFTFHNLSVTHQSYEWNGTTNVHTIPFDLMQFNTDWNWLMEAINFINKTHKNGYPGRDVSYTIKFLLNGGYMFPKLYPAKEFPTLTFSKENLFERVYIFAKEYNTYKK